MALPAVDCDKAFAMQLMLEDTLLSTQTVYFQVALLYPRVVDLWLMLGHCVVFTLSYGRAIGLRLRCRSL